MRKINLSEWCIVVYTKEDFEKAYSKDIRDKLTDLWEKQDVNLYPYCDEINITRYIAYLGDYKYTKHIGVQDIPKESRPPLLYDYEVRKVLS